MPRFDVVALTPEGVRRRCCVAAVRSDALACELRVQEQTRPQALAMLDEHFEPLLRSVLLPSSERAGDLVTVLPHLVEHPERGQHHWDDSLVGMPMATQPWGENSKEF